MEIKKEYSNGEVTVIWKPKKCIHSGECVKGLSEVFQPQQKPWIKVDQANSEDIIKQVAKCPSGALAYKKKDDSEETSTSEILKVTIREKGPLLVHGCIEITHKDGKEEKKENITAFCRCGASKNKPFCDGQHKNINFD